MARLPARVYWFRRFMVLAVLAVLVVVALRLAGGGSESAASVSAESPRQQPTSQVDHQHHHGTQTGTENPGGSDGGHQQTTQQPIPDGDCSPGKVQLTPVVADGIRVGQDVAIQIAMRSTGSAACSFALTPDSMVVDITTMQDDPVWTTDDCSDAITPTRLVLQADASMIVQVTWDGTRSDVRCSPSTVRSAAGDYQVRTAVIGGEPATSSFTLDDALPTQPPPAATPSAGPTSSQTADPSSSPSSNQTSGPSSSSPSAAHT